MKKMEEKTRQGSFIEGIRFCSKNKREFEVFHLYGLFLFYNTKMVPETFFFFNYSFLKLLISPVAARRITP